MATYQSNYTGAQIDAGIAKTSDGTFATASALTTGLAAKQATLVSGTNIKTVNGNSLLGSGNIAISGTGIYCHNVYFVSGANAWYISFATDSGTTFSNISTLITTLSTKYGTARIPTFTSYMLNATAADSNDVSYYHPVLTTLINASKLQILYYNAAGTATSIQYDSSSTISGFTDTVVVI